MAHTCPECGSTCYCNGDWDDCCLDLPDDVNACKHWVECNNEEDISEEEYDLLQGREEEITTRAVVKETPKNYGSVEVRQPTLKNDMFNRIANVICPPNCGGKNG